ncbi:MAG: hypothetical protein IPO60_06325 [Flavobacteriales bacterium]|nr:hypothetical protein [Flavobacteriales bacterium]
MSRRSQKWTGRCPELENRPASVKGTSYETLGTTKEDVRGELPPIVISLDTDRVFEETDMAQPPAKRCVIYLDAVHYKVRENRKVLTKAVYSVYG